MTRLQTLLLLVCLAAQPLAAQEQPSQPAAATADDDAAGAPAGETPAEEAADPATDDGTGGEFGTQDEVALDELENAELDEQTYEQDDDEFIPTEEIPAGEPIPFPTDI